MKLYQIVDFPNREEQKRLGVVPYQKYSRSQFRVVLTGEFRCPNKGEWYLSGAIPEGYRSPNNLSSKYHICRLVTVSVKITETIISE